MNHIIYAGSRHHVYKGIRSGYAGEIIVIALKSSFLHKFCIQNNLFYKLFSNTTELYGHLSMYDSKNHNNLFISSGVPFLIDINRFLFCKFYNVHPSLLPSLKGKDPAIGAIVNNLPIGVSIHEMDSEFDSGPLIWRSPQFNVPDTFDIRDLYAISFKQEFQAGVWLGKNIESYCLDNILELKDTKGFTDSYYSRTVDYGSYQKSWTNLELCRYVRAAALDNYCIKINFPLHDNLSHKIELMSCVILENKDSLSNIFSLHELECINSRDKKPILIYQLERKALLYRNSEFISCTTKDSGFYNLQYDNPRA